MLPIAKELDARLPKNAAPLFAGADAAGPSPGAGDAAEAAGAGCSLVGVRENIRDIILDGNLVNLGCR